MNPKSQPLLLATLDVAVPLWVERLKTYRLATLLARTSGLADIICAKGDVLQFGGKGAAEAFNALAESLAILSFVPGGVKFCDRRWVSVHPEQAPPRSC